MKRPSVGRRGRAAAGARRKASARPRVGLVCAGGGVTGAVYEIGCLQAVEEVLDIDLTALDCYVGVSGGAFVTSLLASGFSATDIYRELSDGGPKPFGVPAASIFRLGVAEYARRALRLPRAAYDAARVLLSRDTSSLTDVALPFLEAIPAGLLENSGVAEYLDALFRRYGRPQRFDELDRVLRIVAVDIDRAETVAFGAGSHRKTPIPLAVQASTALPGLYRPVRIDGRDYVDGGVTKTAHINLAIRAGCELVICVNPLVPIHNASRRSTLGPLAGHGLDTVLGQVLRVLLHGRFEYGLDRYRVEHPEVDILLVEPSRDDLTMFRYDIMRYSARRALAHHGRASGLATLRRRRAHFSKILGRHGLAYRETPREAPRAGRSKDAPAYANLSASLDRLDRALGA